MGCVFCNDPEDLEGVKVYDACNILDGQPCIPCQQYIQLEAQIVATKEVLSQMLVDRHKLRTDINHRHDPILRRFPPEIVSNIFESYVEEDIEDDVDEEDAWEFTSRCPPLVLGAVCQDWRRIAWSSPELWTNISISLSRPDDWNRVEIAQECLSRTGQLPLSIRMMCYPRGTTVASNISGAFYQLISTINQYSSRWESLRVVTLPQLFRLISGDPNGAPIICKLSLGLPVIDYDHDDANSEDFEEDGDIEFSLAGDKPCPSHVETYRIGFKSMDINWNQVTQVNFYDTTIHLDEFVDLLQQAPQLVDCQISRVVNPERVGYQFPTHDIPFAHLKLQSLSIGYWLEADQRGLFLSIFTFPHLTHLDIHVGSSDLDYFEDLVTRSSCRLSNLKLRGTDYNYEPLLRLLRKTSSLRELELTTPTFVYSNTPQILQLLASTSTSDTGDSSQAPFLPNLQSLQYYDNGLVWNASFWTLIPDILASKDINNPHRRPLSKLSLVSTGPHNQQPICEDKDVVLRLVDLIHSEFKLNVTYNYSDVLQLSILHHGIAAHQD